MIIEIKQDTKGYHWYILDKDNPGYLDILSPKGNHVYLRNIPQHMTVGKGWKQYILGSFSAFNEVLKSPHEHLILCPYFTICEHTFQNNVEFTCYHPVNGTFVDIDTTRLVDTFQAIHIDILNHVLKHEVTISQSSRCKTVVATANRETNVEDQMTPVHADSSELAPESTKTKY